MIRCCLCREATDGMVPTDLPGSGWRCRDREHCHQRVVAIIEAHKALAQICEN